MVPICNFVIHWSHGFLIVIFQSVFACEFLHILITWFSHWDLSLPLCLWIPLYPDHMVLSLRSFTLSLLVNSSISWSHGSLIEIFHSVFACEFLYILITWFSNCDLSFCLCLGIPLYPDHMFLLLWSFTLSLLGSESCFGICFMIHLNVNMLHYLDSE